MNNYAQMAADEYEIATIRLLKQLDDTMKSINKEGEKDEQ